MDEPRDDRTPRHSLWQRVRLLAMCLALGTLVAVLGQALVASAAWWLAIPVALAAGWLLVADPTRCMPPR